MRMHRIGMAAVVAGLALFASCGGVAAADKYKLDPDHTVVMWSVTHGPWARVLGQFRQMAGEMTFDPANPTASTLSVTIESASLDSNHYYRDNYVRSDKFLDSLQHKDIKFVSTKVEKTGDKTGTVTGDFTMRGVTKPVALSVTYNHSSAHPSGRYIAGFSAKGTLKRSEWGMTAFLPFVGDDIDFTIETEFLKQ